ncbi:MAG: putative acetyltransferase [Rhizobacter sp.]|nr:putative acetyltransferase [Rhizobacter sp.]
MLMSGLAGCVLAAAAFGVFRAGADAHAQRRIARGLDVHPITADEVAAVRDKFASTSGPALDAVMAEQNAGLSSLLVGWSDGVPVCVATVLWEGPRNSTARAMFPECAEIHSVEVDPGIRSGGVGSRLLAVCEGLAIGRGLRCTGLAVALDNYHAYALYLRLGYTESQRLEYEPEDSVSPPDTLFDANAAPPPSNKVRFLIKSL